MTAVTREENLINTLADEFREIDGIKNAYGFAANPDNLTEPMLPAVLFVPSTFDSSLKAHFNWHNNKIVITAVVFVTPRDSMGGKLKYIENAAIPFLPKIRDHFQTEATIKTLFRVGSLTRVTSFSGAYGAGGTLLTHNGITYVGCIIQWTFIEIT